MFNDDTCSLITADRFDAFPSGIGVGNIIKGQFFALKLLVVG